MVTEQERHLTGKRRKNEDDDESSMKDKDDKKDKEKAKKGKVRVFVGQYLFSLMFFDFFGGLHICVELQHSVIGQPKFAYLSTISFLPCHPCLCWYMLCYLFFLFIYRAINFICRLIDTSG